MSTGSAARRKATVDGQDSEAYRRGRRDGMVWARDHAKADQLRDLVHNFEPGRGARFGRNHSLCQFINDKEHQNAVSVPHHDNPFWRGFVARAEEVLDAAKSHG